MRWNFDSQISVQEQNASMCRELRLVAAAVWTNPDVIVVVVALGFRGVCDVGENGRTLEFQVFCVPT